MSGIIILTVSLHKVNQTLCILTVCFVTPIMTTMFSNQTILANWKQRNNTETSEAINWVLEFVMLAIVITSLIFLEKWQEGAQINFSPNVIFPILGAICIGTSLGLYKRIQMAQKRVSPEFTTVFIFYVAMTIILISPILKYPSLTSQMHNIVDEKSYYENRSIPIIFFFVIGLMATIVAYSICNALQHP